MFRSITLFLISSLLSLALYSQEGYIQGKTVVNIGLGFGATARYASVSSTPINISFSAEHGFNKWWSAGFEVGYRHISYSDTYYTYLGWSQVSNSFTTNINNIAIGSRGSAHIFPILNSALGQDISIDKLDPYLTLHTGVILESISHSGASGFDPGVGSGNWFYVGPSAGVRYCFTENFGSYLELGYNAISYGANIGLSLRF